MLITLHSQNRSTSSVDVDTAANFTNAFNETIVLPRNAKVGVVSLSVNLNGDIVIDGTNDTFAIELGSQKISVVIPQATYKIQDVSSGTGTTTTTYPLIEAMNTALTTAISNAGMASLYTPTENVITHKKIRDGVGLQVDLKPTDSQTSNTGITASNSNTINNGVNTDFSTAIVRNTFSGSASNVAYGSGSDYSVLDCSSEKFDESLSQTTRYGEAVFQLGSTGTDCFLGLWRSSTPNNTPSSFAGFKVASNRIFIQENNESGGITFDTGSAFDTNIDNDGSGNVFVRVILPSGFTPSERRPRYFVSTDNQVNYKEMNLTGISAKSRKQYRSNARLYVGMSFVSTLESRPSASSLTSSSGEWSINTGGSGLSTGVSLMSSTTSTNGVINNGSINISSVDGSGSATGFDMSGATLPDRSTTGDFVVGDTITLANGVIIEKTAATLTTDRIEPQIKSIKATVVDSPTRNPMLPNLQPFVYFNSFLSDLFDVPRRNVGSERDGTLHISSDAAMNVAAHQPEIFISCPTLPINSRTNKISHNTLARVPVGNIDNQGSQAGHHFHECYNIVYHRLHNSNEQTLSQMEVRLTDREGADISQLLHPSTLTLHIDVAST